jgi:hypothetical protein
VEEAVGLEGDDLTADRELAEQQGVRCSRSREWIVLKISVPPEVSCTQAVSGCSASLVATVGADPGAQRMRTAQSDRPSRWESSWPTTRTTRPSNSRR